MAINDDFLYPRSRYHGDFTPEKLVFNANLQEFAQRVSLICGLETGGKLSSEEAYYQIKDLWKQLKKSKKNLGISDNSGDSSTQENI
ncbi:MAG: hypothetical protein AAGJ08_19070 [Cyanobacteria bacterium P01_H01_bin.35]